MRWIFEPYELGVPERYDMVKTKGGTEWAIYERNGWIIETWPKSKIDGEGVQKDYAPAYYFYMIIKYYHPNGMLKSRVKYMLGVTFGKKEFFDEQGNLVEIEDRDAKFEGVKIKREELMEILEKAGVVNFKTGKHSIVHNWPTKRKDLTNPLKTDGSFYKILEDYITISFEPAKIEDGEEVNPPMWYVGVHSYDYEVDYLTVYQINAHTGKYIVKKRKRIMSPEFKYVPIED